MRFWPVLVLEACPPGEAWLSVTNEFNRICLTIRKPKLSVSSPHDFLVENPESLVIDSGKLVDQTLSESILAARTEDPETFKQWQLVAKDFKSLTKAGLWVKNPATGATSFSKSIRYSEGARSFAEKGGKLKPIAGWNLLSIAEPG